MKDDIFVRQALSIIQLTRPWTISQNENYKYLFTIDKGWGGRPELVA